MTPNFLRNKHQRLFVKEIRPLKMLGMVDSDKGKSHLLKEGGASFFQPNLIDYPQGRRIDDLQLEEKRSGHSQNLNLSCIGVAAKNSQKLKQIPSQPLDSLPSKNKLKSYDDGCHEITIDGRKKSHSTGKIPAIEQGSNIRMDNTKSKIEEESNSLSDNPRYICSIFEETENDNKDPKEKNTTHLSAELGFQHHNTEKSRELTINENPSLRSELKPRLEYLDDNSEVVCRSKFPLNKEHIYYNTDEPLRTGQMQIKRNKVNLDRLVIFDSAGDTDFKEKDECSISRNGPNKSKMKKNIDEKTENKQLNTSIRTCEPPIAGYNVSSPCNHLEPIEVDKSESYSLIARRRQDSPNKMINEMNSPIKSLECSQNIDSMSEIEVLKIFEEQRYSFDSTEQFKRHKVTTEKDHQDRISDLSQVYIFGLKKSRWNEMGPNKPTHEEIQL